MISPEEYASALRTNDAEVAFVRLESKFRAALNARLENSDNNLSYESAVIEYMNHTLAAAKSLGLKGFDVWEVPSHGGSRRNNDFSDRYHDFVTAVDHFKVQVQIREAKSYNRYSVALDTGREGQAAGLRRSNKKCNRQFHFKHGEKGASIQQDQCVSCGG